MTRAEICWYVCDTKHQHNVDFRGWFCRTRFLRFSHRSFLLRRLQGLLGHLQILALSGWLAVSLPAEYLEVTVGLRWLIPHMDTPWQRRDVLNTGTSNQTTTSTILQNVISGRRRLLEINERLGNLQHNMHRGRELGANSTLDGPAMEASDYELYFLVNLLHLPFFLISG